jgi:uncharacterized membrane protein
VIGVTVAIVVMYIFPLVFLLVGILMKKHFSEFPDVSVGFHLSYAVKDKETWEEANKYAGRFCIRSSLFLLVLDIVVTCCYIFFKSSLSEASWSTLFIVFIFAALIIQLILLFVLPYHHLKKKFGDDRSKK